MLFSERWKESGRFRDGLRAVRAYLLRTPDSPPHKFKAASFQNMAGYVSRATKNKPTVCFARHIHGISRREESTSDVRGALEERTVHVVVQKSRCVRHWDGKSMCCKIDRNRSMLSSQDVTLRSWLSPRSGESGLRIDSRGGLENTLVRWL